MTTRETISGTYWCSAGKTYRAEWNGTLYQLVTPDGEHVLTLGGDRLRRMIAVGTLTPAKENAMYDASQLNDAHELKLITELLDWHAVDERTLERLGPAEKASIASVRATLTMRANQLRERAPEELQP